MENPRVIFSFFETVIIGSWYDQYGRGTSIFGSGGRCHEARFLSISFHRVRPGLNVQRTPTSGFNFFLTVIDRRCFVVHDRIFFLFLDLSVEIAIQYNTFIRVFLGAFHFFFFFYHVHL